MSRASELAAAFAAKMAAISVDNGYLTNMGQKVFRGKPKPAEEDLPCCVIYEAGDKVQDTTQAARLPAMRKMVDVKLDQRYYFEGHTACDPDNPNDAAHDILTDLKRALFNGDISCDGKVRFLTYVGRGIARREDGLSIISAHIIIDAEIIENLSDP